MSSDNENLDPSKSEQESADGEQGPRDRDRGGVVKRWTVFAIRWAWIGVPAVINLFVIAGQAELDGDICLGSILGDKIATTVTLGMTPIFILIGAVFPLLLNCFPRAWPFLGVALFGISGVLAHVAYGLPAAMIF